MAVSTNRNISPALPISAFVTKDITYTQRSYCATKLETTGLPTKAVQFTTDEYTSIGAITEHFSDTGGLNPAGLNPVGATRCAILSCKAYDEACSPAIN